MNNNLNSIINKRIIAIKGFETSKRDQKKKDISPVYILFEDGETFIELKKQDPFTFHDCSFLAREICIRIDPINWKRIKDNIDGYYPDATVNFGW